MLSLCSCASIGRLKEHGQALLAPVLAPFSDMFVPGGVDGSETLVWTRWVLVMGPSFSIINRMAISKGPVTDSGGGSDESEERLSSKHQTVRS